jgi:hypothetical protein
MKKTFEELKQEFLIKYIIDYEFLSDSTQIQIEEDLTALLEAWDESKLRRIERVVKRAISYIERVDPIYTALQSHIFSELRSLYKPYTGKEE